VLKHRRLVLAIWIIALAACVPAVLRYSNYISYSTSNSALSNTESGRAQLLISQVNPQNESLILVVTKPSTMSEAQLANATLTFQAKLKNDMIPNLSGGVSAFSEYAQLIDKVVGNNTETIRSAYLNFSEAAVQVYSFPLPFFSELG